MTSQNFSIRIERMNEERVECFLDPEFKRHSRNIISKLTNFNINYLIRLQKDEFNRDYPDREDMPPTLTFETFTRSQEKRKVRREKTFEEETKEFIGDQPIESRRRSRFSGSYNLTEIEKAALQVKVETPTNIRKRKLSNTSTASTGSSRLPELKIKIKGIGSNPRIKLEEVSESESHQSSTSLQNQPDYDLCPFYYVTQPTPIISPAVMSIMPTTDQKTHIPVAESIPEKKKSEKRSRETLKESTESSDDDEPVKIKRSVARKKKKTPVTVPSSSSSSDEAPVKPKKTQNLPNGVPKNNCLADSVKAPESNLKQHQNGFMEQESSQTEKKSSESLEKTKIVNPETSETNTKKKKSDGFDKTAKPVEKKPVKEFKKPPIIEPPKLNPKTDKPIKKTVSKPKPSGLEALGGIFTINNGWEETEKKNKEESKKYSNNFVIPKLTKLTSSPSLLVEKNQIVSEKIEETQSMISPPALAKEVVAIKVIHRKVEQIPKESTPSKFNRESNSSSESDDDIPQASSKSPVSESEQELNNDSDSSSVNENSKDLESANENQKQPYQAEKVVENISKEDELDSSHMRCHDDGDESDHDSASECPANEDEAVLSLCADEDDLDDIDDEDYVLPKSAASKEPKVIPALPLYSSEQDELKLTIRKEKPIAVTNMIKDSLLEENAKAEFDKNTNTIMQAAVKTVDTKTDRVLKAHFGGLCPEFTTNTCTDKTCQRLHKYPAEFAVRATLEQESIKIITEAYDVTTNYPKMFEEYFSLFAELMIKKENFESRLSWMIKDCEKTPRMIKFYKNIVDALVVHAKFPFYKAILFVINNHSDTPIGQEILLEMIVSTGPDLIRLLPYLIKLNQTRTIPVKIINEILKNCVTYQDPTLPTFCLNNLLNRPKDQIAQLNSESLKKFIDLQSYLTNTNEEREQKFETVLKKFC